MKKNIKKRLIIWAGVVALILMIPLVGQFPWTKGDFIFAGSVLFVLAAIYELATKNMTKVSHKIIAGIVLLGVIVLILGWAATGPD